MTCDLNVLLFVSVLLYSRLEEFETTKEGFAARVEGASKAQYST